MDGATLGEYRIEETIGRGRTGVVHRATDLRTGRIVALKVLADDVAADPHFRARFRREAALVAALRHPHVVPIHESGEAGGRLFLAMQLVPGPTLRDVIADGTLTVERALGVLSAVAGALDAAHAAGIVHRDVKPHNVLLEHPRRTYLSDFGLARGAADRTLTAPGQVLGTIDYMAPESLDGADPHPAADVYALACLAVECLTGEVPYPRETDAAVMYAHVVDRPPSVSARRPELPVALDAVLAQGMAKGPDERFASAGALATSVLDTFLGDPVAAR